MSSSAFYRSQADRFLRQAALAETLEKLSNLPSGSIISFTYETHSTGVPLIYAGIVVENDTVGRRWYITSIASTYKYKEPEFISWLINNDVENVNVWMDAVSLADWPDTSKSPNLDDFVEAPRPEANDK